MEFIVGLCEFDHIIINRHMGHCPGPIKWLALLGLLFMCPTNNTGRAHDAHAPYDKHQNRTGLTPRAQMRLAAGGDGAPHRSPAVCTGFTASSRSSESPALLTNARPDAFLVNGFAPPNAALALFEGNPFVGSLS